MLPAILFQVRDSIHKKTDNDTKSSLSFPWGAQRVTWIPETVTLQSAHASLSSENLRERGAASRCSILAYLLLQQCRLRATACTAAAHVALSPLSQLTAAHQATNNMRIYPVSQRWLRTSQRETVPEPVQGQSWLASPDGSLATGISPLPSDDSKTLICLCEVHELALKVHWAHTTAGATGGVLRQLPCKSWSASLLTKNGKKIELAQPGDVACAEGKLYTLHAAGSDPVLQHQALTACRDAAHPPAAPCG